MTAQAHSPLSWKDRPGAWLKQRTQIVGQLHWGAVFSAPGERPASGLPRLSGQAVLLEWLVIALIVATFCSGFLNLGSQNPLPGNESEAFQALDYTLVNSIRDFGQFPLWNPYLQTGLPYIADPMLHVYNPLVTGPVLLLGVLDGFKVAVFLSFLAAALGMWALGAVLGFGRAGRIWSALMYAFSGPTVARFFQGQYLFIFGLAWIPWVLAGLILALRTRRPLFVAGTVVAAALLFFSGNAYFAYYMLFIVALFAVVMLFDLRRGRPRVTFHWNQAALMLIIAVLTVGLVAIYLLPLAGFWPHIGKPTNPELSDSHTVGQIFLDLTSKDTWRPDAIKTLGREDFYAYIGLAPLLALLLLPLAIWKRGRRRLTLFFILLAAFVVAWIDVRDMPWHDLYAHTYLFAQFRHPTRMLIVRVLAVVVLGGLGLDALWRLLAPKIRLSRLSVPALARSAGVWLGLLLLVGFMAWSVADVYTTNKQHARTRDPFQPAIDIMQWLRGYDPSIYYVGNPVGWHAAIVSNDLRYIDAWYHFADIRSLAGMINRRPVQARPNYLAQASDQPVALPDPVPVQQIAGHIVYRLPHSLPYAFTVSDQALADVSAGRELWAEDVTPFPATIPGPNGIEVQAQGDPSSTLVVLTTAYLGWQVVVDGRRQPLINVGGYLAVRTLPGVHRYSFTFQPISFKVGLIVSILSLLGLAGLLIFDTGPLAARVRRRRIKTDATYAEGVLRPAGPLDLPENARVWLTVEEKPVPDTRPEPGAPPPPSAEQTRPRRNFKAEWVLFGLALAVYLITRLTALERFPIYFFADEATHAVYAQNLLDHGFKDAKGSFLPIYFEAAGNRWTPLLSVYVHAISVATFGKSVVVTRATSALVSILAAIAVALILKLIFKSRYWWAGALLMAVAPAWFLHSRTGFETVMMSSFFACFLLCYLLYRTRSPRYLFAAILFGAATFYTYSNGQMIMAAAGVLLALVDIRYHLRNWRTTLFGLLLIVLLAMPVLHFRAVQPESMTTHLRAIDSYWFRDEPLAQKVEQFAKTYAYGLSPRYWFIPNEYDLARHRMKGYGNLNLWLFPFFLIGVGWCLWKVKSPTHRTLLIAALATPAGAALVDVSITRVLAFTVPASILIALGLDGILELLNRRIRIPYWLTAAALLVVLSGASLGMLRDALTKGPLWYNDYGLYGMQYGATQLFEEIIPVYLKQNPDTRIMMTSTWANGADTFIRFFLPKDQQSRVQMLNVDYFMKARRPLDQNMLLVMTPTEYEQAKASGKFKSIDVDRIVPYPDGRPGFYFARLTYADDMEQILQQEKAARSQLVVDTITLDGQPVQVSHSIFDAGQLKDLFDGDTFTLARGLEANPLVLEFTFPQPRPIKGLDATFGSMDFTLTARLYGEGATDPQVYSQTFRGLPPDPKVVLNFDQGPALVSKLRLEIQQLNAGDEVHIHVRELAFR